MNNYLTDRQKEKFNQAAEFCLAKIDLMARQLESIGNVFPVSTLPDGRVDATGKGLWGDGHWVGLLWLAYEATGSEKFLAWAKKWTSLIEYRKTDTWTHDLGFLLGLSHLKGYYILGDPYYKQVALTAADYYTRRLNPKIGLIQWHSTQDDDKDNFTSAVDAMMNIALMWWAFEETGDKRFYDVGLSEARSVQRFFLRDDGSTAHLVKYDPRTGEFLEWLAGQGYAPDSCWSRGLAWAVYGFAHAFQKTGHGPFRNAAIKTADYFLNNLPQDLVPFWDFNHPDIPRTFRDSSAASAVASGLFELAQCVDETLRARYETQALAMLESLTDCYTTAGTPHAALLMHGAQHVPIGQRVDHCLIWGDYYYFEGLLRALGKWSKCPHF
jgi:unsaturated chondroitin disaccharide hydrolase